MKEFFKIYPACCSTRFPSNIRMSKVVSGCFLGIELIIISPFGAVNPRTVNSRKPVFALHDKMHRAPIFNHYTRDMNIPSWHYGSPK